LLIVLVISWSFVRVAPSRVDDLFPLWMAISCNGVMALGALLGGWRIVRTMDSRITRLTPVQAVSAKPAGSISLFLASGLPVSTTHTITGAIMGVGGVGRARERDARDCYRLDHYNAGRRIDRGGVPQFWQASLDKACKGVSEDGRCCE